MSKTKNMRFRSQNAFQQAVASLRSAGQTITLTALPYFFDTFYFKYKNQFFSLFFKTFSL
ncbi:MAG: hypothetical protein EAZ85_10215 [Bacteroidetes bacterium]|nr:MAG: hypothetical protein EAZ85_10215 [Bacteroidota bacterium]